MALDVTPLQWLRQRLHEVYLEKGDKFDVANWSWSSCARRAG